MGTIYLRCTISLHQGGMQLLHVSLPTHIHPYICTCHTCTYVCKLLIMHMPRDLWHVCKDNNMQPILMPWHYYIHQSRVTSKQHSTRRGLIVLYGTARIMCTNTRSSIKAWTYSKVLLINYVSSYICILIKILSYTAMWSWLYRASQHCNYAGLTIINLPWWHSAIIYYTLLLFYSVIKLIMIASSINIYSYIIYIWAK